MWNTDLYNQFEKERMQPSIDLATRISHSECKRILDVGCGSGMSTLAIKNQFPDAEIIGTDLSETMLEKAKNLIKDAKWVQRDCSKRLDDLGKFDIIFSNAFLQWLNNQEEFIRNTRELLNDHGKFAIQIPSFEVLEISEIIKTAARKFDTDNKLFADKSNDPCNYSLKEYYDMLTKYYSDVEVWQTDYIHQMPDSNAIVNFVKSTALIPYLDKLSESQKSEFIDVLRKETEKVYHKRENSKVLFPFKRMFFIATK